MDKPTTFTFGSLFSGIGGLDLGLERAGMICKWQVENNDFCQKVLAKHWPNVARHGDVRHVGRDDLSRVDLIAGGFPCQPHSQAGERKASQDERDLWPEFARIIRELKPRWVVAENVLGLLSSEDGAFFGGVLRDLAKAGYDARWSVLSAAQFGAPHLRERVIIVAHASGQRRQQITGSPYGDESQDEGRSTAHHYQSPSNGKSHEQRYVAYTNSDNRRRAQRTDARSMACACGADAEGQGYSQRGAYQCGSSPLAHTGSPEWWAGTEGWGNVFDWTNAGWQKAPGGLEFCGEELAYTSEPGLSIRGRAGYATHGAQDGTGMESQFERYGELANPDFQSLEVGQRLGGDSFAQRTPAERGSDCASGTWAVESCLGRDFARLSTRMDGDIDEKRHQADSGEVLSSLRARDDEKEVQRQVGGLSGIHAAPVLQYGVHGSRKIQRGTNTCSIQETSSQASRFVLPEMWGNGESTGASSRQQSSQQQLIEPGDVVQFLSRQMALAEWEEVAEKTIGVQALRSACAALGYVPETLSALQEVWQSLSYQKKSWVIVHASGRYPWPAGPGQQQYEWESPRVITEKVANRTARLKGLGNAVVPALAEYVGHCIMAAEAEMAGVA